MAKTQRTSVFTSLVNDFRIDLRVANRSESTWNFYQQKLNGFISWLDENGINDPARISVSVVRGFLSEIGEGRTPGGNHAYWRAVRAFLSFLERERVIDENPFRRLRKPSYDVELLDPIPLEVVQALIAACGEDAIGLRDKAIFYVLLDTGVRAGELRALKVSDVDIESGTVSVRKSKSHHGRTLYLGVADKRSVRTYLRTRDEVGNHEPLFLAYHRDGTCTDLGYDGLRAIVVRRAMDAGVEPPPLHAFRRTFAITMLRGGADIATMLRFMGHGSLGVLMRYLKLVDEEIKESHQRHSPGDALRRRKR